MVLVVNEQQIREVAELDSASLAAVEEAFSWVADDRVSMPPIMHIEVAEHHGDVDIKSAYVSGLDAFAVKIASGFFKNQERGLPNSSGMMVVLSAETGFCEAVLLDNGYLTNLRTGLAGGVAAKYLAPERVRTAGVIGAGAQARFQIRGLRLVREFDELLVWSLFEDETARYVEEMSAELGLPVRAAASAEEVVRASDFVVTTTPSREPIIKAAWLHPGLHITAMGSDLPGKQELEAEVVTKADRYVCDRRSQVALLGELAHAIKAGLLPEDVAVTELGELTSGRKPGRQSAEEITVCDLTGMGVQDTAISLLTYQRAKDRQAGVIV
jgi:ornithine cyclodeaminase